MKACFAVIVWSAIFATQVMADGVTLAQVYSAALDGVSVQGPAPVMGAVNGTAVNSGSGASVASDGSYSQTWTGSASASATALKAAVSSTISCSANCGTYQIPGGGTVQTGANAWFDTVLSVSPGFQVASLSFVFSVDGTSTSSGSLTGAASLEGETCGIGGGFCYDPEPRTHDNVQLSSGSNIVRLNMKPWVYGQPFNVEFILGAYATDEDIDNSTFNYIVSGPGAATVDFSHTAILTAIQAVDANGNVVHDGTVIYDYNGTNLPGTVAATPEPGTFGGLALGLLVSAAFGLRAGRRCAG